MYLKLTKTLLALSLLPQITMAQSKTEPGTYQVDAMHSKIGFEVPHLVISSVEGSFRAFEGQVEIHSDFTKSKVSAAIDVASIDTGVDKRDDHLRSPDFFDVKKYPKMTFQSVEIKGSQDNFDLIGDLTIHGVKKRVTFKAKYLGAVTDGYGNRKAAFQAQTKINRKEFGLTWNNVVEAGPVVGDEITLVLKIQAAKQAQAQKG